MTKLLIKSGYIRDGFQVNGKVIEVKDEEVRMISGLGIKFEIIEESKEEPAYKRKKIKDGTDNV